MWTPPTTWAANPIPEWLREGGPGLPDEWKTALWAMTIVDPLRADPLKDEGLPAYLEFTPESVIVERGVRRETLLDLRWAQLADCIEGTPDGDRLAVPFVRRGPYWVPTPLGCKLAGIRLEEFDDDSPQWVMGGVEEPRGVHVRLQPKGRTMTSRILRWAEKSATQRAEARARAAKEAEERLDRERAADFWGRKRYASKGRQKKAAKRKKRRAA